LARGALCLRLAHRRAPFNAAASFFCKDSLAFECDYLYSDERCRCVFRAPTGPAAAGRLLAWAAVEFAARPDAGSARHNATPGADLCPGGQANALPPGLRRALATGAVFRLSCGRKAPCSA
jgi:hypothetical protein